MQWQVVNRKIHFYYQTYIYNSDTKKKDKRIFHALRTKNIEEAQKKRKVLDLKYEKEYRP